MPRLRLVKGRDGRYLSMPLSRTPPGVKSTVVSTFQATSDLLFHSKQRSWIAI